jgi:hypothetical protein
VQDFLVEIEERERSMRIISGTAAIVAGLGLMAAVPSGARADTTSFILDTAGTLPAGNYGTVTILSGVDCNPDCGANTLEIQVTLSGTNHFATTGIGGGIEASFAFDLDGTTSFNTLTSVTGLPATWSMLSLTAGSIHMDGGGFFDYGALFSNGGNTDGSSLDFFISATGLGSTAFNVTGVAADICTVAPNASNNCGTGGLTGVVVPGPLVGAGLPGLIAACAGLVAFARRRRQKLA